MDEPPYDREREPDYQWLDRFAIVVCWFFGFALLLVVFLIVIGCSVFEVPPTTTTTTTTTTPLMAPLPDHITVATTTTTISLSVDTPTS